MMTRCNDKACVSVRESTANDWLQLHLTETDRVDFLGIIHEMCPGDGSRCEHIYFH